MTKNETIIHVGIHKAGSTFVQGELLPKLNNINPLTFYKKNDFLEKEFLYISQCAEIYYNNQIELGISESLKKFKNIFISSETLSGTGYNVFTGGFLINDIAERLHRIFPKGKIIIIIRNQKDAVESYYKDDIKLGFLGNYKSWLKYRSDNCQLNYFKYFNMINTYFKIFGKNNVNVILFEKLFNQDYLKNNLENFGINTSGIENVNFNKKYNNTYLPITLKITPLINRFFGSKLTHGVTHGSDPRLKIYNLWRNYLSEYFNKLSLLTGMKKTKFEFSGYDSFLYDQFHYDNEKLSELIDVNLDKQGYI